MGYFYLDWPDNQPIKCRVCQNCKDISPNIQVNTNCSYCVTQLVMTSNNQFDMNFLSKSCLPHCPLSPTGEIRTTCCNTAFCNEPIPGILRGFMIYFFLNMFNFKMFGKVKFILNLLDIRLHISHFIITYCKVDDYSN